MTTRVQDLGLEHHLFGDPHHTAVGRSGPLDIFGTPGVRAVSEEPWQDSALRHDLHDSEQAASVKLILPYQPTTVLVNGRAYLPLAHQPERADQQPFDTISPDQPDYLTRMLQGVFRARKQAASRRDFYRTVAEQLLKDTGALYIVFDVSHWPVSYPPSSALAVTTIFEQGSNELAETFFRDARKDDNFIVKEGDAMDIIAPYTGQELSTLRSRMEGDAENRRQYKHMFSYRPNGKTYTIGCVGLHGIPVSEKLGSNTLTTIILALDAFLHDDLQRGEYKTGDY